MVSWGVRLAWVYDSLVNYVNLTNVIHGRPAHPVDPRTLKHIVKAINYPCIISTTIWYFSLNISIYAFISIRNNIA
jgi:hypothetical protein